MVAICSATSWVAFSVCPASVLTSGGDDGKAAAGLARARRLDGGVEGQQVRLSRDRLDQANDLADAARGAAEVCHRARGARPFGYGGAGDILGACGLCRDFRNGSGQFFDGTCRCGDVLGGVVDPCLGCLCFRRYGVGRAVEIGGGVFEML